MIEYDGKTWLFVERMDRWRRIGSIAVCQILSDENSSRFKDVIIEPFHLSYPNVFEYKGKVWMIPESGQNKDIRLYVATNFPDKWEFVKSLYSGANYVDTSFVTRINDDEFIMNSYDWDSRSSHFFRFDMNSKEFQKLPDNVSMMNERCGGNCYGNYRVLQDCTAQYGSKIILRRIDNLDFVHGNAADSPHDELLPRDFDVKTNLKLDTCHTYNRSKSVEVIDFSFERFSLLEPIFSIHNKFLLKMGMITE